MTQWHGDLSKRKGSGGRKHAPRTKRAREMGSDPTATIVGKTKVSFVKARGGSTKARLIRADSAVVTDPSSKKSEKTRILRVVKNPANIDYERRGVITRGSIIETALGLAKVTSRPGQAGTISAVLIQQTQG